MAGAVSSLEQGIERLREIVAWFDQHYGFDHDCGESCGFLSINDARVLLRALDPAYGREAA